MKDDIFLEGAVERYKGFLLMIRRNMETKSKNFCVPTYNIELMWHTHQLHPLSYFNDTVSLLGKVLGHDDTYSDRTKGQKLDVGFSTTTKQWKEMFSSSRYWRAGAMYRDVAPVQGQSNHSNTNQSSNIMFMEILVEIIEVRNLSSDHKHKLVLSVSKTQNDMLFNGKSHFSICKDTEETQAVMFQCEPKGEFLFELVDDSSKSFGSCSISLLELDLKLPTLKWLEFNSGYDRVLRASVTWLFDMQGHAITCRARSQGIIVLSCKGHDWFAVVFRLLGIWGLLILPRNILLHCTLANTITSVPDPTASPYNVVGSYATPAYPPPGFQQPAQSNSYYYTGPNPVPAKPHTLVHDPVQRAQSEFSTGEATTLPHAFIARTLHDPASGTWNMDTSASSHLNNSVTSLSTVFNMSRGIFTQLYPSPIPHAFLLIQHTCHQRLGHSGGKVLHRFVSFNFISYNNEKPPILFHACQLGKHVRLSFVSSSTVISSCFEIIHSDKYAIEILERANMANCNLSRTPIDTESKLAVMNMGCSCFQSTMDLVAYSDADWVGCPTTRRSTSGYYVFLGNHLLSWSSKYQPKLSRFSAKAKYRGVANVVAETFHHMDLRRGEQKYNSIYNTSCSTECMIVSVWTMGEACSGRGVVRVVVVVVDVVRVVLDVVLVVVVVVM
nr:hypothetical protein [Tanacetum cinerariifolium]